MSAHKPDCSGYEDCDCFHITIRRDEYEALKEVAMVANAIYNDNETPWSILAAALEKLNIVNKETK